jgi:hypothetical protein
MTESEWLACDDPRPMLSLLRGRASARKLWLFAVASYRLWLSHLPAIVQASGLKQAPVDQRLEFPTEAVVAALRLNAVRVMEAHADGLADRDAMRLAREGSDLPIPPGEDAWEAARAVAELAAPESQPGWALARAPRQLGATGRPQPGRHTALLRELFINPFRPMPPIDPSWLAWSGGCVRNLAQTIYDERAFERLPILGDALEEAGCTNEEMLSHCRSGGEHVRGCWAVDALLGQE